VERVSDSKESRQMRDALLAIRKKLARMRLESDEAMTRLAETRRAADVNAAARDEQRTRQDAAS
jgi:hypothetical protein